MNTLIQMNSFVWYTGQIYLMWLMHNSNTNVWVYQLFFFNTADNECELMLNNWNESTWIVPTMTLIKHLNVLLTLVYT